VKANFSCSVPRRNCDFDLIPASNREPIIEDGNIIGLFDVTGGGAISLEPGGQFELSGAPLETVHQTQAELMEHLAQVKEVARPVGIGFLGIGMTPNWSRADMPMMPKGRYRIMTAYMPKVGKLGLDMMYRTCTVHTNLDYSSEADMVKKLRVSLALQPIMTAMFANSPFTEGKPNGFLSFRAEIWRDTDADRSGMLPWAFEPGMGFERWVDYALDVPMYFVKHREHYVDVAGQSFRDLMAGKLPGMPGARATISDWANHISTIFPEVRLRRYLEMRGADSGSWRRLPALPADWGGLLYDDDSLEAAWDLVKDWSAQDRQKLRDQVPCRAAVWAIVLATAPYLASARPAPSPAAAPAFAPIRNSRKSNRRHRSTPQRQVRLGLRLARARGAEQVNAANLDQGHSDLDNLTAGVIGQHAAVVVVFPHFDRMALSDLKHRNLLSHRLEADFEACAALGACSAPQFFCSAPLLILKWSY
jgi:glutamate--cysteine ligase